MRLSELKTGEKGVIVKVLGHGGFRKRIVEMGFIRGKIVTVLLNAPLQDPVKYKIMGYEISLRHSEAAMIEIISTDEARKLEEEEAQKLGLTEVSKKYGDDDCRLSDEQLHKAAPNLTAISLTLSICPELIHYQPIVRRNFTSGNKSLKTLPTS